MMILGNFKRLIFFVMLMMVIASTHAADKKAAKKKSVDTGVKELSGISIVGNKEAPKSLYIVPWKNSKVGVETSLNSSFLNEDLVPVDKEVFMRELDFYDISHEAQ